MADANMVRQSKGMYLRSLEMANFRSCLQTKVEFQPGLTLLVGENNSGKSNVINAIRLATEPLGGRRSRYFEREDRSYGQEEPVTIVAEFSGLSPAQQGHCISALDYPSGSAWYGIRCTFGAERVARPVIEKLAGKELSMDSEPEKREQINHVYLTPLRDAQRELDSASGVRLAFVIRCLCDDEEIDSLLEVAVSQSRELGGHSVIERAQGEIQRHIVDLTSALREQQVGLGLVEPELLRIARALRVKIGDSGFSLGDIAQSGLGFSNLLFMATVILELKHAQDSELTLFLVEEPEAHLHPQLQAILLDYLREQAETSGQDDGLRPAGRSQVVATTHSPNLASAVGTKNVVVLRTVPESTTDNEADLATQRTIAIPLASIPLNENERRKIDQYLDVTRAELLFARRMILVEGIAEAILMPALAECVLRGEQNEESRSALKKFKGVSVISVGSVDFVPYVKLLLDKSAGISVADRLIVVTDSDPLGAEADEGTLPGEKRAKELQEIAIGQGNQDRLFVALAPNTLEADLLTPINTNGPILRDVFLKLKPRSLSTWEAFEGSADPSGAFYRKLKSSSNYLQKGEFAHEVALRIRLTETMFTCPLYLESAIRQSLAP